MSSVLLSHAPLHGIGHLATHALYAFILKVSNQHGEIQVRVITSHGLGPGNFVSFVEREALPTEVYLTIHESALHR